MKKFVYVIFHLDPYSGECDCSDCSGEKSLAFICSDKRIVDAYKKDWIKKNVLPKAINTKAAKEYFNRYHEIEKVKITYKIRIF